MLKLITYYLFNKDLSSSCWHRYSWLQLRNDLILVILLCVAFFHFVRYHNIVYIYSYFFAVNSSVHHIWMNEWKQKKTKTPLDEFICSSFISYVDELNVKRYTDETEEYLRTHTHTTRNHRISCDDHNTQLDCFCSRCPYSCFTFVTMTNNKMIIIICVPHTACR